MDIRPLKASERIAAQEHARKLVAGRKPTQRSSNTQSRWPTWLLVSGFIAIAIALVFAFINSAIHLHDIGLRVARIHMSDEPSVYALSASNVVMAEFTVIALMLVLTFIEKSERLVRTALWIVSIGAMLYALNGNVASAEPPPVTDMFTLYQWVSATFPPFTVMVLSFALKTIALKFVEKRHADTHAYTSDLAAWNERIQNAELQATWDKHYSEALKEAIQKANARSERGRVALANLARSDWYALVEREKNSENWYAEETHVQQTAALLAEVNATPPTEEDTQEAKPIRVRRKRNATQDKRVAAAGKRTGELAHAVIETEAGYVATCPTCETQFNQPTRRSAINALTSHLRHAHRTAKNGV